MEGQEYISQQQTGGKMNMSRKLGFYKKEEKKQRLSILYDAGSRIEELLNEAFSLMRKETGYQDYLPKRDVFQYVLEDFINRRKEEK